MSELGVFAVDRGIFEHPLLKNNAPYSKIEAWLWLLAEAAWKPRTMVISGQAIALQRGQLAHSIRYMAKAWGWPKSTVSRFLDRLKTGTMIGTDNGTAYAVITICKYEEYQRVALPGGTSNGPPIGTGAGQQRDKAENIQSIQEEEVSEADASARTPKAARKRHSYTPDFEAAWLAYPTDANMSKLKAFAAWCRLDVEDQRKVVDAIPAFIAFCRKDPTYRPVHFVRFISEHRFDGFLGDGRAKLADPTDWQRRLTYARTNRKWSEAEWGPAPGQPGTLVPVDLVQPGDGDGWQEWGKAA